MPSTGPYGTGILDNFNRANASPLDGNWDPQTGLESFNSNCELQSNTAGFAITATAYLTKHGPACETFATFPTVAVGGRTRLLARLSTADNLAAGYSCEWTPAAVEFQLMRWDAGVRTQLGSGVSGTLASGEGMAIVCIGSTIEGWQYTGGAWTKVVTATDNTYRNRGYPGFAFGNATGIIDDFGGGTILIPNFDFSRLSKKAAFDRP